MPLRDEHLLAMLARGDARIQGSLPALPADTPEGTFLAKIRAIAEPYGFLLYHSYSSRKSEPGFPDIVLTDGTSLLMYELKTNAGKVTKEQERWLSLLAHTTNVECGVWRPHMWGEIVERLTRGKQ